MANGVVACVLLKQELLLLILIYIKIKRTVHVYRNSKNVNVGANSVHADANTEVSDEETNNELFVLFH